MIPRALIVGLMSVLVVALAAAAGALSVQRYTPYKQTRIGGPFTMVDMDGYRVTEASLSGRPSALFFGYTSCPDICPTTLSALTSVMGRMGPGADRLNVVFVTVDPERDTPQAMKLYLSSFDPRIRGLTGTPAQVDAMAEAYHVYHRRGPVRDGGYTVDHSAEIYLFDDAGKLGGEIGYGEAEDRMFAKLTALATPPTAQRPTAASADLWADVAGLARRLCGFRDVINLR